MYAVNDDGSLNEYKGDSGSISDGYGVDENDVPQVIKVICKVPQVGVFMRVGSHMARSYSRQDYWTTTPITEILEDYIDDDERRCIKFKTKNSTYLWKE